MQKNFKKSRFFLSLFILAIVSYIIYQQGLNGPFVFDDHGNIQQNTQIQITELNLNTLNSAAWSGHAGPLQRPVAMLSFALNYYFAEGYHYFSFKLTNLLIQIACAWLVFIFCLQLLRLPSIQNSLSIKSKAIPFIAFSMATLWAAHPINLTSVLYIVQRMTSLSTLFTLATLIFYLKARNNLTGAALPKQLLLFSSSFICFLLAIFSKENAVLIPVYLLLIEWLFFTQQSPWLGFRSLSPTTRKSLWVLLTSLAIATFLYALNYAANGYSQRTFTLTERALTETRVICFYLALIILPRINAFGLFHDDIELSTSLISPWTTLPAILIIIGLIAIAIRVRKDKPLIAFGVLFFFACHLLESTIFGLEITHEHRNHLASIGIIIALSGLFIHHKPFNKRIYLIASTAFFIILSSTTFLRSYQWQDDYHLAQYEAAHHPKSPATLALLSNIAYKHQEYEVAEQAINQARILLASESSYAINSAVIAVLLDKPVSSGLNDEILRKLHDNPFSTSTQIAFSHISTHLSNDAFKPIHPYFVEWLEVLVEKLGATQRASTYHYYLAKAYLITGNMLGAINSHQQAFNLNNTFINPLFEMGNIFLALGQAGNANIVLQQIKQANTNPALEKHYDKHIKELEVAIASIE